MPLKYVLDENLRGPLWSLFTRHNRKGDHPVDIVRVGDRDSVSLGTGDPELLRWAEDEGRILISKDVRTMPGHLAKHLAPGRHSPGIMALRPQAPLREVLEFLVLAAYATDPAEWADTHRYVP
jgi:hypothetical protein